MGFVAGGGVKAGTIEAWGGTTAPDGYLLCDGGAVSRALYSDLFAVIGTTYGEGDGSTTFNVPNYSSARFITSATVGVNGNGNKMVWRNIEKKLDNATPYIGDGYRVGVTGTDSAGGSSKTLGLSTSASTSGIVGTASLASSCKFIIKY